MKLFVYGTLMQGFHNHGVLGKAQFLGEGTVFGELYHLGGYPGFKHGHNKVTGEIYEVPDEQWARLDRLEGRPHLYDRETINATLYDAEHDLLEPMDVQIYVYQRDVPEHARIVTGRFEG